MSSFIIILFLSILFPALISPENEVEIRSVYVMFEWDQEPEAISYNIQILNPVSNNILIDIIYLNRICLMLIYRKRSLYIMLKSKY